VLLIGVGGCWLARSPSSAYAQDAVFAKMVQLTERKGFKNMPMGAFCRELKSPDRNCRAYQMFWDDDDDKTRREFSTLVDSGGMRRIFLSFRVTVKAAQLVVFSTDMEGNLLGAAQGVKTKHFWNVSTVVITPELEAKFATEKNYWTAPKLVAEIESIPDRREYK
jgi:hypothetical protein